MIKILGISGSAIGQGNTEIFLEEALKPVRKEKEVSVEIVSLAKRNILDCRHCNWCFVKQTEGKFCALEDDMALIYPKILEADGMLWATPVYFARMSGAMAQFMDRLRCFMYGSFYGGRLRNRVGGPLVVSWMRHSGVETALNTLIWGFLTLEMVVATPGSFATFGGAGVSSLGGTGKFETGDRHQVLRDTFGIKTAQKTALRVLELTRLLKPGNG
jgi:multimeric flavodoxin WrbA